MADWLRDLATRILKTTYYGNADLLAQEIAAGLGADGPITLDRPLILDQQGSVPPLQFHQNPVTDVGDTFPPPFTVTVKGGEPVDPPSFPGGTFVFDGGNTDGWNPAPVDFKLPDDPFLPPQSLDDRPDRPQADAVAVGGGGGGVGFYGVVVSGSGGTYTIAYTLADGTTATGSFTMAGMDASATLDAGTEVTCFTYDTGNKFVAPVWL